MNRGIKSNTICLVKISTGIIPSGSESKFNLVACLLKETCEDGVRTLFHRPEHELVDDDNQKTKRKNQAVTTKKIRSSSTENKYTTKTDPLFLAFSLKKNIDSLL